MKKKERDPLPPIAPLRRWTLANDFNLMKFVERELTRERHPAPRRAKTLYPSGMSATLEDGTVIGGCSFSDACRIADIKTNHETEMYMALIWRLGKAIEGEVIDAMKCAGAYESSGVKFYDPKHNVSGELDIVGKFRILGEKLSDPPQVRYYVVEAKSVYSTGVTATITGRARAWKGQPAFDPKPKESNLMQVMVYLDQFSQERAQEFRLDFAKLIYIPRDKPNSGRSYTVMLFTSEELPPELDSYRALMKPGHHYAAVSTEGFSPYVETRFSLESLYERSDYLMSLLRKRQVPPRPFEKFYSEEKIEKLYKEGEIGKTAYEEWVKKGKPAADLQVTPGHSLCQSYCDFRDQCWKKNGEPNKALDAQIIEALSTIYPDEQKE